MERAGRERDDAMGKGKSAPFGAKYPIHQPIIFLRYDGY
jgi:hypothetical protein